MRAFVAIIWPCFSLVLGSHLKLNSVFLAFSNIGSPPRKNVKKQFHPSNLDPSKAKMHKLVPATNSQETAKTKSFSIRHGHFPEPLLALRLCLGHPSHFGPSTFFHNFIFGIVTRLDASETTRNAKIVPNLHSNDKSQCKLQKDKTL